MLWIFFFFKQKTAYEMRISDWSSDVCSSDLQSQRRVTAATTGSRYRPRNDIAVESTPDRSLSDLFKSSRAVEATTGCGPSSPRCRVVIIAASVVSIGRFGSDRNHATPARALAGSAERTGRDAKSGGSGRRGEDGGEMG